MAIELVVVEPLELEGTVYGVGDVISEATLLFKAAQLHPNNFRRRVVADPVVPAAVAPAVVVNNEAQQEKK